MRICIADAAAATCSFYAEPCNRPKVHEQACQVSYRHVKKGEGQVASAMPLQGQKKIGQI